MQWLQEDVAPSGDYKRSSHTECLLPGTVQRRTATHSSQEPDTHFTDGETKAQRLSHLPRPHGQAPLPLGLRRNKGPQSLPFGPPVPPTLTDLAPG